MFYGAADTDGAMGRRSAGGMRRGRRGFSFGRQAGSGMFNDGGQVCSELTGGCFCYDESAAPREEVMGGWERHAAGD